MHDFTFNMYHTTLPRITRKKDLIYFLSFVLYNIYSLRINQGQGVSVVDALDYFFSYWVSGNIDFTVSKTRPRLQVNRIICIRKKFVAIKKFMRPNVSMKTIKIRYKC